MPAFSGQVQWIESLQIRIAVLVFRPSGGKYICIDVHPWLMPSVSSSIGPRQRALQSTCIVVYLHLLASIFAYCRHRLVVVDDDNGLSVRIGQIAVLRFTKSLKSVVVRRFPQSYTLLLQAMPHFASYNSRPLQS